MSALANSIRTKVSGLRVRAGQFATRAGMWAMTGEWQDLRSSRFRKNYPHRQASQDHTLDLGKRENMIMAARVLCQVNGIGKSVLRSYANYTVGHCCPKWTTSDEAWNDEVNQRAKFWMSSCHARGQHNLRTLAELVVKSMIRDGDLLVEKMVEDGFPMIDIIEADRVTANVTGINIDTDEIIGGIKFDGRGRATAYSICDRVRWGNFKNQRWLPATSVLHVFDSDRVDAKRGVSAFAQALHDVADFDEAVNSEKIAQKTASKLALIISNTLGRAQGNPLQDDTDANGDAIKTENIGDGAIRYQMNGDKVEAFQSARPGDGWFKMCDLIVRMISISLGLPYEFVWNMAGLTGPAVRLTTKQADRNFQHTMNVLEEKFLGPVFAWWINVEMEAGRIPFNAEWHDFKFTRPIMASIDANRETIADVAEMNAGVKSGHDVCLESQRDIYEVQIQLAREAKHRLEVCSLPEFEGVRPEDIRVNASTVARLQADAAEDAAESKAEKPTGNPMPDGNGGMEDAEDDDE
jgi:capsid protein